MEACAKEEEEEAQADRARTLGPRATEGGAELEQGRARARAAERGRAKKIQKLSRSSVMRMVPRREPSLRTMLDTPQTRPATLRERSRWRICEMANAGALSLLIL